MFFNDGKGTIYYGIKKYFRTSTEAPGRMAQEASGTQAGDSDSCFSAQVGALLTARELQELKVTAVLVEREAVHNTVLDSGYDGQVVMDRTVNGFRATPGPKWA